MKLLIMSDSHGWGEEIVQLVKRHQHEVDAMIHCGDSELQVDASELQGLKMVKGNCDFGADFPEDLIETFGSFVVYATHGHLYNVKMTHVPLSYRAEEVGANLVCFGHSHVATSFKEQGIVFINPGSFRLPRSPKEQTYVICEVTDSTIHVRFYERESAEELRTLSENYSR
jgi:uncharacterized protein